ncbi:MAG: DHH family phosphoesterase [Oscillospiraceae bacterium]|jgi:phosphoesterase RecJ-like protein|nr:DHH family phosphoesterase [Oscillospiraceae bacterium]
MTIDLKPCAARLAAMDDVCILAHQHPDGDTLGSGYALAHTLCAMGKRVRVLCADPIPKDFAFMPDGLREEAGGDAAIVSVDVADEKLLGRIAETYGGQVDINIDHHATNLMFAKENYVDDSAAATAEMILDLIDLLGAPLNQQVASCLYAGISTDTGCFRYQNTTARSHLYAARLMDCGVQTEKLDRMFFETKSKSYVLLERMAMEKMRFFCDDRVALIAVTQEMLEQTGSNDNEYVRLVPQTRQMEGVLVGVSIRERRDGTYKISLRTNEPVDASAICAKLGGGGHARAAGCASALPLETTIQTIITVIEPFLV